MTDSEKLQYIMDNMATKADIAAMQADIKGLKTDMKTVKKKVAFTADVLEGTLKMVDNLEQRYKAM